MGRRRYRRLTPQMREEICLLRATGLSHRAIAMVVGQAAATVAYVVAPFGGVFRGGVLEGRPAGRLSLADRIEILAGLREQASFTAIAARIGKSVSTVSREVGGRGGRDRYRPVVAQQRAIEIGRAHV